ncbi:MAG: AAA family ATPase, partial [Leifsonia sp.]
AGLVDGATLGLFLSLASGAGREAEAAPDGPAAEFGRRHPRDLSTGERRLLAIAIQSAAQPQLLLVDEPTRGLDGAARRLVASALRAAAWSGSAVVIATHDRAFAAGLASRALTMSAGRLTAADAPSVAGNRSSAIADGPGGPASGSAIAGTSSVPSVPSPAPAIPAPVVPAPPERPTARRFGTWQAWLLLGGSLLAAASFCWPLLVPALPAQAQAAAPFAAIALLPLVLIAVALGLDGEVRSAATLALLGTLTAIGAAVRVVGTGVGGVEAVFVLLILAGRAFGARFGFLLGVLTIALSSTMWGGFGPWTPFQMFACGWVGAGAGLLPRTRSTAAEIVMLSAYGVVASYVFGLAMNLWFWPFAVGTASEIAYAPGAPLARNAGSFLLYSLVTSTITWDTLRAITSVVGVVVAGPAVLAALRRAKLAAPVRRPRGTRTPGSQTPRPRSTSPRGGGTRTRRSTAPDEAAAPPTGPPPSVPA